MRFTSSSSFFFFFFFLSNLLRMLIAGKRLVLLYRSSPTETFFIDELSVFKLLCVVCQT